MKKVELGRLHTITVHGSVTRIINSIGKLRLNTGAKIHYENTREIVSPLSLEASETQSKVRVDSS